MSSGEGAGAGDGAGSGLPDDKRLRQLPYMALTMMMVAILLPAVNYSMRLGDPTPQQLIVAICIGIFSSVFCLWILDSVGVVTFRSPALRGTIYTAGVGAIIAAGVAGFRGGLSDRAYPYEGVWNIRVHSVADNSFVVDHSAVLIYSRSASAYWGYSETLKPEQGPSQAAALELVEFLPDTPSIALRLYFRDAENISIKQSLVEKQDGKRFESKSSDDSAKYIVTLARQR